MSDIWIALSRVVLAQWSQICMFAIPLWMLDMMGIIWWCVPVNFGITLPCFCLHSMACSGTGGPCNGRSHLTALKVARKDHGRTLSSLLRRESKPMLANSCSPCGRTVAGMQAEHFSWPCARSRVHRFTGLPWAAVIPLRYSGSQGLACRNKLLDSHVHDKAYFA